MILDFCWLLNFFFHFSLILLFFIEFKNFMRRNSFPGKTFRFYKCIQMYAAVKGRPGGRPDGDHQNLWISIRKICYHGKSPLLAFTFTLSTVGLWAGISEQTLKSSHMRISSLRILNRAPKWLLMNFRWKTTV